MRNNTYKFDKYELPVTPGVVDLRDAFAIGKYIDGVKHLEYAQYEGPLKKIKTIKTKNDYFIIDGRTRSRANLDTGMYHVPALIMPSENPGLEKLLSRITSYKLEDIPISLGERKH